MDVAKMHTQLRAQFAIKEMCNSGEGEGKQECDIYNSVKLLL